ncbi:probable methyltransferase At1g27930 isoform X1 [Malus sylvestris]|uniref:probable methyltransferase At1g27930 isoform X1 n=1 Tax=Malus sylvestris TaxID=3752 RepID=UPI0021AC1E26|nr:probable methyltransferase At1g27930 isoform X1 [Malus sylvestris]
MKNRSPLSERPVFLVVILVLLIGAGLAISSFFQDGNSVFYSIAGPTFLRAVDDAPAAIQLQAILHYATSSQTPQQSRDEITVSFEVLKSRSPCNFLVFGLGFDSLMWASLNPRGTTLFLEEDPKWVQTVLKDAPQLRAETVRYRTQLKEADELLSSYRSQRSCSPSEAVLRGNTECRLALDNLPDEVYDKEWDLIMVDAPRGYFPEAPGRMGAIFSAAVMARRRRGSGVTHVFLHDVDRKVEKAFAEEFLCRKFLVKAVGRLWHFEIPSAANVTHGDGERFC